MRGLIFDMDGVLVDVRESYLQSIIETVRVFSGREISHQMIFSAGAEAGLNNDWEVCRVVLAAFGVKPEFRDIVDTFQGILLGKNGKGLIQRDKWLLEKELLGELASIYPLGIVTGRPRSEAELRLRAENAERFFSAVITLGDLPAGRDKPDPAGINMAVSRLGTGENLYFGDTMNDVRAAFAAGVEPVLVSQPGLSSGHSYEFEERERVRFFLDDINNIKEVINGW